VHVEARVPLEVSKKIPPAGVDDIFGTRAKGGENSQQRRLPTVPVGKVIANFLTNESLVQTYPNFATLARIYIAWTLSSADCERGFSVLKDTKTKKRSCLKYETLNQLMMISINGPAIRDFDFQSALQLFLGCRKRKVKVGRVHNNFQILCRVPCTIQYTLFIIHI
jgi:hypothetical protein